MNSFFETPDKKKRQRLMIGDLAVIIVNLYLSLVLSMVLSGTLRPFLDTIGHLSSFFSRALAIGNVVFFITVIFILCGVVHVGIYHLIGLYRITAAQKLWRIAIRLCAGVISAIFLIFIGLVIVSEITYPASVWGFHAGTLFLMLLEWRVIYFKKHAAGGPYRILIINGDNHSREAGKILSSNGSAQFFELSVVPKNEFFNNGWQNHVLNRGDFNMIVYPFSEDLSDDHLVSLIRKKFEGISICDSLTFYKNCAGSFPVLALDARWMINLSISLSLTERFQQRTKRIFDILVSAAGLLLATPVIVVTALLVKITSRGPIFFVDERLGLHQKPFRLYKFRTMIQNAEKDTGPVWAKKDDPRITWIGRFLRKSRLDELPQLFNILKGDMSIVGPRPIRKYFADQLTEKFPYYYLRFYVKPGLTGWAQVLGDYGDSMEGQLKKLEYDLFYIHEYSLFLDAEILLKTVGKVFAGAGQ